MTVRYRCNSEKTPHSFNGYDKDLMQQLPKMYVKEFPAILTESSGISTKLAKLMRTLFQSGVGPQRLSRVLRAMHTERFDELQFQYYDKMVDRITNPTISDYYSKKKDVDTNSYDEFSTFSDKTKYAGYVPCANYLSYAYSSLIEEYVPFMDQLNSMLNGVVLKGDHSFKIIKHMGKTNGTSVFSSLYTVMNEYEEIRMQVLAHTKSLRELSGNFDSMMESYRNYGFEMPQVFYTDNVAADKNTLEKYIPSLTENVKRLIVDKNTGVASFSDSIQLPVASIPEYISVEVKDDVEGINDACHKILSYVDNDERNEIFVGFDCEWVAPHFRRRTTSSTSHVALVQVYVEELAMVFLFRIFSFDRNSFPTKLRDLVASKRIRKVGKNIAGDLTRLKHYIYETNGELELGSYCFNRSVISSKKMSLRVICSAVLRVDLPKDSNVRLSNWEASVLSDQQVYYAALDAYIAIAIFNATKHLQLVNEPVTKNSPIGTFVGVYPKGSSKTLSASAFGYIFNIDDNESHQLSIDNNIVVPSERSGMALVRFVKVERPGLILEKYKAANREHEESNCVTLEEFGDIPFFAYVNYKCLRTASESVGLSNHSSDASTVSQDDNIASISLSGLNSGSSSSSSNDTSSHQQTYIPSRVLKDAFHLIEQIPISLRHGMAKDFKRRFRDCLFAVNEEDKKKVEEYLVSIGSDWETHLVNNPDFIWERVRRTIPPPGELANLVQNCFDTYSNLKCQKTGNTLFDKESMAASKRVMDQIKVGYVSDVVDGPPLYTEKGLDKNGLMKYACSRGTSSVEGSCHFNIIRKFSSFNAGPRLTNMALYDYRLCHNINVSRF